MTGTFACKDSMLILTMLARLLLSADYTALAHSSTNLDLSKLIIAMAIYRFYTLCTL